MLSLSARQCCGFWAYFLNCILLLFCADLRVPGQALGVLPPAGDTAKDGQGKLSSHRANLLPQLPRNGTAPHLNYFIIGAKRLHHCLQNSCVCGGMSEVSSRHVVKFYVYDNCSIYVVLQNI